MFLSFSRHYRCCNRRLFTNVRCCLLNLISRATLFTKALVSHSTYFRVNAVRLTNGCVLLFSNRIVIHSFIIW
ncbi:hypothetical protein HanIR_Chr04g0190231 [Helianthus annuus]|nr:hypothetical protein HanIR_Chr04g0190231 [Helianthus annuus]